MVTAPKSSSLGGQGQHDPWVEVLTQTIQPLLVKQSIYGAPASISLAEGRHMGTPTAKEPGGSMFPGLPQTCPSERNGCND